MRDETRHRRRSSESGSKSARTPSRSASGTAVSQRWGGLAAKAAIAAIVSLMAVIFILRHFGVDDVATDAKDQTWPSDGVATSLGRAAASLKPVPPALDQAEAAAKEALAASPLSTAALGLLAQTADAAGDHATNARYRSLILERTLRDFATLRWKYDDALRRRDFATMMPIADALLRQNFTQADARYFIGTMATLAADPAARPYLLEILAKPSVWRRAFLNTLAAIGPIDAFPDIIAEVPPDPAAPTTAAWNFYLDRLTKGGESRRAYVLWTGLLPPEEIPRLGLIYNGDFETPPSGRMFDWIITPAKGMEIALDTSEPGEGKTSLRASFGGTPMTFMNVRQTLILDPGRYSLSGLVKTLDLKTDRGLSWRIYCVNQGMTQLLATSPSFSGTSDWSKFSVDFEVPPVACDYQSIRLELPARIEAERRIQGSIWVDGLSLLPKIGDDLTAPASAGG